MSAWNFDSAGSVATAFNGPMTPGAPPTYPAGALLVIGACQEAGSTVAPTIPGWTKFTLNTAVSAVAGWMKLATGSNGSDTMPAITWGTDFAACGCVAVDPGFALLALPTVDVQNEKGANLTSGMSLPGISAPSADNAIVFNFSMRNNGTATGVAISTVGSFSKRAQVTPNTNNHPLLVIQDWIQTTATSMVQVTQATSPADSVARTAQSQTVALLLPPDPSMQGAAAVGSSGAGSLSTAIKAASAATVAMTALATLTPWASVTLSGVLYTGPGGALDPNFWQDVVPGVGSVIWYDPAKITIYPNAEISSISNNCSAVAQFNNGIAWSYGLIVIVPDFVSYPHVVAAAAAGLTTAVQMAGAAVAVVTETGSINTGIQLVSHALAVASAVATMINGIQLNAAASVQVGATGALSGGQASLQGNMNAVSSALSSLSTRIQIIGQALAATTVAGALSAKVAFDSAATILTQANGQLTTAISLTADAAIVSSAAGSALITSALSGAANVTSSALGSILAGILVASNAMIQTSGAGDLSTGISLAGGAEVDIAFQIHLPGLEAQFGKAQVNVLSPTGLPVDLATFIEGTACIVTIAYFNAQGVPFVPNGVSYRVDDILSAQSLLPYTNVAPGLSNAITVLGVTNHMVSLTRDSEPHQVLFKIIDGQGNINYARAEFELLRTTGVN